LFTVISYAVIVVMLSYTVCPVIHDEVFLINAKTENVFHHDFDREKFYQAIPLGNKRVLRQICMVVFYQVMPLGNKRVLRQICIIVFYQAMPLGNKRVLRQICIVFFYQAMPLGNKRVLRQFA